MRKIETLKAYEALVQETYMFAIIIGIIALVLAFFIASIIKWQGGKNPKDHIKRRVWFVIIGLIAFFAFFLYNSLYVSSYITKPPLQDKWVTDNILATLIALGVYVIAGVLTMLMMRGSKWGSILGKSKK
jgi:quinol-cytochrome oxidoreductase complex cytochrome b subunit